MISSSLDYRQNPVTMRNCLDAVDSLSIDSRLQDSLSADGALWKLVRMLFAFDPALLVMEQEKVATNAEDSAQRVGGSRGCGCGCGCGGGGGSCGDGLYANRVSETLRCVNSLIYLRRCGKFLEY